MRAPGSAPASRVLVVDDEPALVRAVAINLRAAGFDVTTAATGSEALDVLRAGGVDVVLLDLGLPDIDGTEVLTALRRTSSVPVVVLSARQQNADKVEALDLGADDYVTTPFAMTELLARLRACLRRASTPDGDGAVGVVRVGDLSIDLDRKQLERAGQPVRLTPTEWAILELLARHRGRLVSREQLLREVWGEGYERQTHYLRVYLAQLRRKVEADPAAPRLLVTVAGMGYLLEDGPGE